MTVTHKTLFYRSCWPLRLFYRNTSTHTNQTFLFHRHPFIHTV